MIQIYNFPTENRFLLDGNNTPITITSTNGVGYYFRAKIYIDDILFDEQGWSRRDNFTAVKDLVYLYHAYFKPEPLNFALGITEQTHLKKKVTIIIEERKTLDDGLVTSLVLPNFYLLYNAKAAIFNDTDKLCFLGLDMPVLRIHPQGFVCIPFFVNANNEAISISVLDDQNNILTNQSIAAFTGKKVFLFNWAATGVQNGTLFLKVLIQVGHIIIEKNYKIIDLPNYEIKEVVYQNNFGFYIPAYFDGDFEDTSGFKVQSYEQVDSSQTVFAVNEEQTYTINTGFLNIQEKSIIQDIANSIDCYFNTGAKHLKVIPAIKKTTNFKSRLNQYGQDLQFTVKVGLPFSNLNLETVSAILTAGNDSYAVYTGTVGVIGNVTANDTNSLNNAVDFTQISSSHVGISLNTSNGEINIDNNVPAGSYTLVYRISQIGFPNNYAQATANVVVSNVNIQANPTTISIEPNVNGVVGNVLANDTYGGAQATSENVVISSIYISNPAISLDTTTGEVIIASNTAIGSYTLNYRIHQIGFPDNYSENSFTVNVAYVNPVVANPNSFSVNQGTGGVLGNVLTNDSFGTNQATTSHVVIALVSSSNAGITLNTSTGAVSVTNSIAAGSYTLVYRISQIGNLNNTSTATVTVAVNQVNGVTFSSSYSASGSPTSGNPVNQSFNGTVTVVGASFNFKAVASIFVNNGTTASASVTINGENRYAQISGAGISKSTAILLAPGTYSYSINVQVTGIGGSGSGSIEAIQV